MAFTQLLVDRNKIGTNAVIKKKPLWLVYLIIHVTPLAATVPLMGIRASTIDSAAEKQNSSSFIFNGTQTAGCTVAVAAALVFSHVRDFSRYRSPMRLPARLQKNGLLTLDVNKWLEQLAKHKVTYSDKTPRGVGLLSVLTEWMALVQS